MTTLEVVKEPPLLTAERWASDEIKGRTGHGQSKWLHDHPRSWLLALHTLRGDVERQIAVRRRRLLALEKVDDAGRPLGSYLAAKREADDRNQAAIRFLEGLKKRIREVSSMFGLEDAVPSVAQLVQDLVALQALLSIDEVGAAEAKVCALIERYARHAA